MEISEVVAAATDSNSGVPELLDQPLSLSTAFAS